MNKLLTIHMIKKTLRVPMYHPWRKDEHGNPAIQHVNPATVRSGKAALMGYIPIPKVEAPPVPAPAPAPKPKPTPAPVNQKGGNDAD